MGLAGRQAGVCGVFFAVLLPSFVLGGCGAIAAVLILAPSACVASWDSVAAGGYGRAPKLRTRLITLWHTMFGNSRPACTKAAPCRIGRPSGLPWAPSV